MQWTEVGMAEIGISINRNYRHKLEWTKAEWTEVGMVEIGLDRNGNDLLETTQALNTLVWCNYIAYWCCKVNWCICGAKYYL